MRCSLKFSHSCTLTILLFQKWMILEYPLRMQYYFWIATSSKFLKLLKVQCDHHPACLKIVYFSLRVLFQVIGLNVEASTNTSYLKEKRIWFIDISKDIGENFFRVDRFIPFQTHEFSLKPEIAKTIQQFSANQKFRHFFVLWVF